MTTQETAKILAILQTAYPRAWGNQSLQAALKIWVTQFSDYSAREVYDAVQKLIATSRFCPTIAEAKAQLAPPDSLWDLCMDLRMQNGGIVVMDARQEARAAEILRQALAQGAAGMLAEHIRAVLMQYATRKKALGEKQQALEGSIAK